MPETPHWKAKLFIISMSNKYTSIVRKKLSLPMRVLKDKMYGRCLDYGCGRGFDCDFLGIDGFDPNWRPERPVGKYDTIFCNYVLNVVSEEEQAEIIKDIRDLLNPNGRAYFTVRRDIKIDYKVKDYIQRFVILNMESVHKEKGKFEIYIMSL